MCEQISGDATVCEIADKTDGVVTHSSDEDNSEASGNSDCEEDEWTTSNIALLLCFIFIKTFYIV